MVSFQPDADNRQVLSNGTGNGCPKSFARCFEYSGCEIDLVIFDFLEKVAHSIGSIFSAEAFFHIPSEASFHIPSEASRAMPARVIHAYTRSDSFRIRIVWFQPKEDSDRIRISCFKIQKRAGLKTNCIFRSSLRAVCTGLRRALPLYGKSIFYMMAQML